LGVVSSSDPEARTPTSASVARAATTRPHVAPPSQNVVVRHGFGAGGGSGARGAVAIALRSRLTARLAIA
jgi:hypothetical protein